MRSINTLQISAHPIGLFFLFFFSVFAFAGLVTVPRHSNAGQGSVDFFGVSGLTYVADFVHWWLAKAPNQRKVPFLEAGVRFVGSCFDSKEPRPSIGITEVSSHELGVCSPSLEMLRLATQDPKNGHERADKMGRHEFMMNHDSEAKSRERVDPQKVATHPRDIEALRSEAGEGLGR